ALEADEELRPHVVPGREHEEQEEERAGEGRDLDVGLPDDHPDHQCAHHGAEAEALDLDLADEIPHAEREEDGDLREAPEQAAGLLEQRGHRVDSAWTARVAGRGRGRTSTTSPAYDALRRAQASRHRRDVRKTTEGLSDPTDAVVRRDRKSTRLNS